MRAVIDWRSHDDGGRKSPPCGYGEPPYSTVVRWLDDDRPWPPDDVWTLVVEKTEDVEAHLHRWIADVRFVSDKAPGDRLRAGGRFELYEGPRCVADGLLTGS